MAEHGDLDVLGMLASQAPEEEVDKPACHKVEEGQSHRPIVAYRLLPAQRPGQVSEPYGAGWCWLLALQRPHVSGLGAFRARRHLELDDLPLIK